MRMIMAAAVAFLAFATVAHAGVRCLNSKPCFNTCIPYNKVCHKPKSPPLLCLNSKPCNGRCIPFSQTCNNNQTAPAAGSSGRSSTPGAP